MDRKIKLKYQGRCRRCGQMIPTGTKAYWEPKRGIWHLECRSEKNDASILNRPLAFTSGRSHISFINQLIRAMLYLLYVPSLLLLFLFGARTYPRGFVPRNGNTWWMYASTFLGLVLFFLTVVVHRKILRRLD